MSGSPVAVCGFNGDGWSDFKLVPLSLLARLWAVVERGRLVADNFAVCVE